MALDSIIARRFGELSDKAAEVAQMKTFECSSAETGRHYFNIPSGPFKEWGTSVLNLLQRTSGENSVHYRQFLKEYERFTESESGFLDCLAVFSAAKEDFLGGYLFDVRALAKAEVLADALAQAGELLDAGYKDPACVLGRVALETTLKELSGKHGVVPGKLDKMNADLCKAMPTTWPSRSR